MYYDLIIPVKSSSPQLIEMTRNCIYTAKTESEVNVIIIETGEGATYDGLSIKFNGAFNYNRCLNTGLRYAKGDVHILANNDIIFHKGWSDIGGWMKINGFDSGSALSNDRRQRGFLRGDYIYEGYNIGTHITGWCIFVTREAIYKIGPLDESHDFWYSDNAYADQLKKHGLRHGLFCNVRVDHIGSQTLKSIPYRNQRNYTLNERYAV